MKTKLFSAIMILVMLIGVSMSTPATLAQGPGVIRFYDNFESGGPGWLTDGFWNLVVQPHTIGVHPAISPALVKLPDAGRLPSAYSGSRAMWFGQACTGTFIGCDFNTITQTENNGGRSTQAHTGVLSSPGIDLVGVSKAYLEFKTWWEIEGVDTPSFDIMQVEVVSSAGGAILGRINPVNDVNGEAFRPYSSGGLGQIGQWITVRMDLSPYTGQEVHISFRFDTRDSFYNGFRGWLIDDMKVVATELAAPQVNLLEPSTAQASSFITIRGQNFVTGATIQIGGVTASEIAVISTDEIQVKVPAGLSLGSHNVIVTNPDGKQSPAISLQVTNIPAPVITSITPNSGADDKVTHVVITGQNFENGAQAFIADTPLSVTSISSQDSPMTVATTELTGRGRSVHTTSEVVAAFTMLEADAPAGVLPGGFQNVKVVNPDGQQDILQGGFQVKAIVNPSTFGADGQTFTPGPNGTTTIRTGLNRPVTISTPVDCDGKKVVSATVSHGGQAVPMSPAGGGIWTATILAKTNGPVTVSVVCEDGKTASKTVGGIELIDPSGYIYDAQTGDEQTGQRVPGATVTLYHKHPTLGDIVWDAKQFDQVNPQTTNGEGRYGWDVPAGDYFITIRHICYEDKQSQVVTVPPPVLDLNVGLQPKSKPCSIVYLPVILNNN